MSTVPGRSNGLTAASYVALVDLAPPLADALLDTLRVEAIAAYAAPATDRPLAELAARQPRPLDRVFVDRSASARARAVLDAELARSADDHARAAEEGAGGASGPGPSGASDGAAPAGTRGGSTVDDDVWAGIVASLQGPSAQVERPGIDTAPQPGATTYSQSFEVLRDGERHRPEDADAGQGEGGADRSADPAIPAAPGVAGRNDGERGDGEGHYTPPPPPPLPRLDPVGKAAWLGVAGAPAALIVGALAGVDLSGWLGFLLVSCFVAGFVTLVVRMKDFRDDGWDDGAVV